MFMIFNITQLNHACALSGLPYVIFRLQKQRSGSFLHIRWGINKCTFTKILIAEVANAIQFKFQIRKQKCEMMIKKNIKVQKEVI